jgi:hypothetical protein
MRKEFTCAQMLRKSLKIFSSREFRVGWKETMLAFIEALRNARDECGNFLASCLLDSPYSRLAASAARTRGALLEEMAMTVEDSPHRGRFDTRLGREHLNSELIEVGRRCHDLVRRIHLPTIRDSCVTWRTDLISCRCLVRQPASRPNAVGVAMMTSLLPALLRDWRGFSLSGVIPDD